MTSPPSQRLRAVIAIETVMIGGLLPLGPLMRSFRQSPRRTTEKIIGCADAIAGT